MKWESRLTVVESIVAQELEAENRWASWREEAYDRVDAMLVHVPEQLRDAVIDAIEAVTAAGTRMWNWLLDPFEKGAPPIAADYRFPASLIELLLAPPRDIWIGHTCESCGIRVPIYMTWTNDPDPPPKLAIFPTCPACGGKTCYWVRFEKTSA